MGLVILVVFGAAIVGLFALATYSRRGEGTPDRHGERSSVRFSMVESLFNEGEQALLDEQGFGMGEGPLEAILSALAKSGVPVNKADADGNGWGAHIGERGASSYLLLQVLDDGPQQGELLAHVTVQDPSSGGPGRSEHLQPLHDALSGMEGISDVRWLLAGEDPWADGESGPFEGDPER